MEKVIAANRKITFEFILNIQRSNRLSRMERNPMATFGSGEWVGGAPVSAAGLVHRRESSPGRL